MATYVVMKPPVRGHEYAAREAVFVRDGFSWLGFLLPPLWLLWHRLWIEAALAFLAAALFSGLGELAGFGLSSSLLGLLVSLYIGLEGQALRIGAMRRRGWLEWGVVEADSQGDADIRYALEAIDGSSETEAPVQIVPATTIGKPAQAQSTFGLVPFSSRS